MKKTTFRRVIASRTTTIQIITIEVTMLEDPQEAVVIDAAAQPQSLPAEILPVPGETRCETLSEPLTNNFETDQSEPKNLEYPR